MIFYFSGTGNTLWAARKLAEATGETLIPMAEAAPGTQYTLAEGERIGFCFPVHGWRPPQIVRRFVANLLIANAEGHYCYALCTCGDSIGKTMEILNTDLAACGLKAESVFSLIMPESYVALPFMYTDKPEKERRKLATAARRMANVCESVVNREVGVVDTKLGPMPWILSHVIGAVFNGCLITDKPFCTDSEKCIGCGVCAKVCPIGNIYNGSDHKPLWKHNKRCTSCLSCYHHCPRHAIEYGSLTRRRGQYYFGKRKGNEQ